MPDVDADTHPADPAPSLRAVTVLAVDIVEYSLRSTVDQTKAIVQLTSMIEQCAAFARCRDRGAVLTAPAGDGFLIAFLDDVAAPIQCAQELDRFVKSAGKFRVRQAIHVGPIEVIERDLSGRTNMAGEGANTASRALSASGPDDIILTRRAFEFVGEASGLEGSFIELGEITVKHGQRIEVFKLDKARASRDELAPYLRAAERVHARATRQGETSLASVRVIADRLRSLRRETLWSIVLVPIALLLNAGIEQSTVGRRLRLVAYETLQGGPASSLDSSPVTFVDIGARFNTAKGETDLRKLRTLLDEIASMEPAAVAIDIDFGFHDDLHSKTGELGRYLDEDGWIVPRAKELTSAGIPVFLAVYKGLASQDREDWLSKGYADLAVHPLRPSDTLQGQMVMLGDLNLLGNHVPALSSQLARAYRARHRIPEPRDSVWVTRYSEVGASQWPARVQDGGDAGAAATLQGPVYLLNGSALPAIKRTDLAAFADEPFLRGDDVELRIRGKAVLIGATSEPSDFFTMPLTGQREWGPYFHAIATYTEIAAPLYGLTAQVRMGIVLASVMAVLLAAQVGVRRSIALAHRPQDHRLTSRTAWIVAPVLVLGSVLLARVGVLYTEYVAVVLVVSLAPWLDRNARHMRSHWSPKQLIESRKR